MRHMGRMGPMGRCGQLMRADVVLHAILKGWQSSSPRLAQQRLPWVGTKSEANPEGFGSRCTVNGDSTPTGLNGSFMATQGRPCGPTLGYKITTLSGSQGQGSRRTAGDGIDDLRGPDARSRKPVHTGRMGRVFCVARTTCCPGARSAQEVADRVRNSSVASCALIEVSIKAPGQQVVRATQNPRPIGPIGPLCRIGPITAARSAKS